MIDMAFIVAGSCVRQAKQEDASEAPPAKGFPVWVMLGSIVAAVCGAGLIAFIAWRLVDLMFKWNGISE